MKRLKKEQRETKKKKRHPIVGITLVCAVLASLCAGTLAWFLLARYEAGLLEVCAVQQDGYVQLVLDQIHLRSGQEGVEDILSTMDASSNKYWTFSRDQDIFYKEHVHIVP